MKTYYPPIARKLLCLIILSLSITYSCNNDNDMMENTLFDPASASEDVENLETEVSVENTYFSVEDLPEMGFQRRTAIFPALEPEDSSAKDKKNEGAAKDPGHRKLMFDLAQIDSIGGTIDKIKLGFTVEDDVANGTVSVFSANKDKNPDDSLPVEDTPEQVVMIGELVGDFAVGKEYEIELDPTKLLPEVFSLEVYNDKILDSALGSKEDGFPKGDYFLVVTYFVHKEAKALPVDINGDAVHNDNAAVSDEKNNKEQLSAVTAKASSGNEYPDSRPSATPVSGSAPLKVQFGSSSSSDDKGIASYKWYFMDGTTATGPNPSHTFTEPGSYKVILSVTDEEGLENGRIIIINVYGSNSDNRPPDARPDATPSSGDAPLKVQFGSSRSSDDKGIASYQWNFKDGNKTTGPSPSHTFTEPGTYKVVMTAIDDEGLKNARIVVVTVTGSNSGSEKSAEDESSTSGSGSGSSTGGNGDQNKGGSNDNPSNGIKASSFGYNSSDATQALKKAINSSNSTIIVDKQSSDWVVGPLWFKQLGNKKIIFESGVVLRAKKGAYRPQDRLFQLEDSDNIEIQGYGATFAMNGSEHSGEQNHALSIINSSNITVEGLTITGAGGDGIYVSRRSHGQYSSNIVVDGVTSTKNRRQGMTVTSIDGLQVKNSTFSGSSGRSPSAGIDFEPEHVNDRLDNIVVTHSTFKDNNGPGIMFAVNKSSNSSRPVDATFRNIRVSNNSINNSRAYPCEIELGMSTDHVKNPVKGTITFDGLTVENSRWSAIYTKKTLEAYHVNVKNAVIKDVSKGSDKAAIHIGLLGYGNTSYANMGGFTFENVLIDYDGVDPSLKLFGPGHGNWKLANLKGKIEVESPNGVRFYDNLNKLANSSSSSVNLQIVEN